MLPGQGALGPTPGGLGGQGVQPLWPRWTGLLSVPAAAGGLPARQEVLGGGRAGSPAGLISSLLTNPFTQEQAERDGARHEASQRRSSPASAVSSLG